jgi:hypothetical protein
VLLAAPAAEPGAASAPAVPAAGSVGCSYSCGGAGGGDAPATVPGHWPGLAPDQSGAASILSSCVYFLAMCFLVHCVLALSRPGPAAELPLPAAYPHSDGKLLGLRSGHFRGIRLAAPHLRSGANCLDPRKNGPFAALPAPTQKSRRSFPPVVRIDSSRQVLSSGIAFPMGVSAAGASLKNERCGETSLLGGERALPGWGGSRQPLDRQV